MGEQMSRHIFNLFDRLWKEIEVALAGGVTARLNDTQVTIHQDFSVDIEGPYTEVRINGATMVRSGPQEPAPNLRF